MNKTQLQQRAVMLIEQLSLADLKAVIDYLTTLQDQATRDTTQESATGSKTAKRSKPKPTSENPIAQRIIEAVEKSYDVTMEDAETLLQVIKENQKPVQFKSPFVMSEHDNQ